jgi:hypothetical protein
MVSILIKIVNTVAADSTIQRKACFTAGVGDLPPECSAILALAEITPQT